MCIGKVSPAAVLAALAMGGLGLPHIDHSLTGGRGAPSRRSCLICLADSLQDAADLLEGLAERGDGVTTESPASHR